MIQRGKKRGRDNGKKYKKRSYRREDWERTEGERKRERKPLPWERRNKKKGSHEKSLPVQ